MLESTPKVWEVQNQIDKTNKKGFNAYMIFCYWGSTRNNVNMKIPLEYSLNYFNFKLLSD